MPNTTLSQAITEAYASAPSGVIILHTIEVRHPTFIDEEGNPSAIRVVRDYNNLTAKLEDSAPLNAGEEVEFISYSFNFSLPQVTDTLLPEATLTIDNVSGEIIENIERAVESQDIIRITYRPYLSTDLSGPHHDPPLHLTLTNIFVDVFQVSGTARFSDLANLSFPNKLYTVKEFPDLLGQ